ncbi:hypothetical protein A2572_01135 [Candidatus Collierbacteria bacterium RIFOXYD1_FULL_40_9]|uniref:Transcription elongation factor GreA/GreB C-terminal domain-containing protein n=1 Tax=Candidatus Collierbacteria bacterium RIFOXYD1_FULL_40_9 TaxID=1817731 RepID=A0A1F5FP29_9BACT|nr:MAG: hypothetical protein A2572_01135 [Candidatus Collierbacteria bacterium RIFOXYD1_FULL_40_9]
MVDLAIVLKKEIDKIDLWINQAAQERDESATPTESTHDQTRQVANQLFNSLLEERSKLQKLTNIVKRFNRVFEIQKSNGDVFKVMLTPDGLGGKEVDSVLLVGEGSLLGQKLKDLNINDSYEINSIGYKVVGVTKIEP